MDYKVTDTQLASIADAIRTKGGTSASMAFPDGFMSAISAIPTGSAVLEPLSVSQNGSYTPSAGIDGFDSVVVDVQSGGGSNDNFKIAMGVMSGSVYDSEITVLRAQAFAYNNMITGVEMPMVSSLGASAFRDCTALITASFPACSKIDLATFYNCPSLKTAYFGSGSYVANSAFTNCSSLESLYLLSSQMMSLQSAYAFGNTPISNSSYLGHFGSIYVPSSLVDAYKSAAKWSAYADRFVAYTE